jgi:hypothetical protein
LNQCRADSAKQAARPGAPRIRSCILVFFYGGPSHLDTYDPKPKAPAQIRGEYQPISTAIPGLYFGEYLPHMARLAGKLAVVRGMHHPMRNHNAAAAEALSGRTPLAGDLELLADDGRSFPTLGSAVSFGLGQNASLLPYVALPHTMYNVVQLPGQTPGILGGRYDRFQVLGNPNAADFKIAALEPQPGRAAQAWNSREKLLRELNLLPDDGAGQRMLQNQGRALRLLATEEVRMGFDMGSEDPQTRERYGRHLLGQSLLLARRLVETGVNFVAAFDGAHNAQEANWDSHQTIFPRHRQLIPTADQALSALIEDLEARGLLESTLVIGMGEFGRTPKINAQAGRDHWPDCFSVVLSGGGLRGGTLYGASDAIGAYPDKDPVTPADLAATVLWRFGIDPGQEYHDPAGRPWRLSDGQPLTALF